MDQCCSAGLDFEVGKAVVVGSDLVKACGIVGPGLIQAVVVAVVVASGLCLGLCLEVLCYSRLMRVIAVVGDLSAVVAGLVTAALAVGIGEMVSQVFAAFIDEFKSTCMAVNDDFLFKKSFHTYI